jgi:3-oxoacyl-[acyl-carrier protein] reductase
MFFNMTEQEWDDVIAVHLKGHFACTKAAAVVMRQQRYGRIINFSSISGLWGNAGQANYGAAKSGTAGFTRVVARDLGRYGVTCNAIVPRALTRMTGDLPKGPSQERVVGRGIEAWPPDHVAPMTCYLATDQAWNINGQIFLVYGGTVAVLAHPLPQRTIFKQGMWTADELIEMVPQMMEGIANPAPPPEDLDVPGRPES